MKHRSLAFTLMLVICLAGVPPLSRATAQDALTFSGHIKVGGEGRPQFSVKLYPPKESDKPILLTNTDDYGDFQFTDLQTSSYLLEIYLGTELVYQEIVELSSSTCCEIDLSGKEVRKECPCTRAASRGR